MLKAIKDKRNAVNDKVIELESLLVSIEWSGVNKKTSVLTSRRVNQINSQLTEWYNDKTVQQFLYDTEDIEKISQKLQPLAMISWINPADFTIESRIVIQKLLSHQAYSKRELWSLAVANLIELGRFIENAQPRDTVTAKWYRMFVIDHAVARMYPDKVAKPRRDDIADFTEPAGRLREELKDNFEKLIPIPFRANEKKDRTRLEFNPEHDPYLLRAAHYYGHRGNNYLVNLQEMKWTVNDNSTRNNFLIVLNLINDALGAYLQAIDLRLIAFAKSFGSKQSDLHDKDKSCSASLVAWSDGWMAKNEAFMLISQALADIANQYAAISCVYCYKYAQCVYEKNGSHQEAVEMAKLNLDKAAHYWRRANIRGTEEGIGEPYRITVRRRLAEHMVFIASKGLAGLPVNYYEKQIEIWEKDIFSRFYNMIQIATAKR